MAADPQLDTDAAPWVWGVDCGSKALGFAGVHLKQPLFFAKVLRWRTERESLPIGRSLAKAEERIRQEAALTRMQLGDPASIGVERPSGPKPNPSLMMHTGAIIVGLTRVVEYSPTLWQGATEWRPVAGVPRPLRPKEDAKERMRRWEVGNGFSRSMGRELEMDAVEALGVAIAEATRQHGVSWLAMWLDYLNEPV